MNLNKAMVIGRVTQDLELKTTPNGNQVLSFSIASNKSWKDQSGQKQEKAEFHNIVAWGKPAELIAQYVTKGQELYVDGRLETRNWEEKESGKKMYRTEIVLENFQFGAKPGGASYNNNDSPMPEEDSSSPVKKAAPTIDYPNEEIDPDDIPF